MPSFMNSESPTNEVQGEERAHNSLDYLIDSLKTEEEEPRVGCAGDTTVTAAATMSTGRSKGIPATCCEKNYLLFFSFSTFVFILAHGTV